MIVQNGLVFTDKGKFEELSIETREDKISSLLPSTSQKASSPLIHSADISTAKQEIVDAADCYVIPGLIDIHMHGCMGVDFCDIAKASSQEEANSVLQKIASYELSQGITAFCPTTMTMPLEDLLSISRYSANYDSKEACADFAGIYLEGPFLSPARCGAQNKDYLRLPDYHTFTKLSEESHHLIRVVAIAPELDGAVDFIKCVNSNMPQITCSLAHTDADYDTACHAFEAGASQVTHLFSAMAPLHHRNPGVIGAAFDTSNCYVECISDGIHLAPAIIRTCFQLFRAYNTPNYHDACAPSPDFLWSSSTNRIILISDSTMATGMPDGHYHLGNQDITVQNKLATLADGTIAGSCSNLMDCLRAAVSFGIPLEHALTSATINPARAIGIDSLHGSISVGKYANLVLLDKATLEIQGIIYHGKCYTL